MGYDRKLRRCHFFESDGSPRNGGCLKPSKCKFVHPGDEKWANLPYQPPPRWLREDYDSREYRETSARDRDRTRGANSHTRYNSPSPVDRSVYDDRHTPQYFAVSSRELSPPTQRKYLSSDTLNPGPPTSKLFATVTPTTSTLSFTRPTFAPGRSQSSLAGSEENINSPLRSLSFASTTPTTTQPRPPSSPHPSTPPKLKSEDIIMGSPVLSTNVLQPPPQPLAPAPPIPSAPPIRPPPALPLELASTSYSMPEKTIVQRREIWNERVELLSESVILREKMLKLEEEISQRHSYFTRSQARFPALAGDKDILDRKLAQLQKQRDETEKQHTKAMETLVSADTWPNPPPPDAEEQSQRYKESLRFLEDLRQTANRMYGVLQEIQHSSKQKHTTTEQGSMELDENTSRPSERRRPSCDASDENVASQDPQVSDLELQEFRDKVQDLESRMTAFENDLENELSETILERVENRFEELMAHEESRQKVDNVLPTFKQEVDARLQQTESGLGDLAVEIEFMMNRSGELNKEILALRAENFEYNQKLLQWEEMFKQQHEARERSHRAIDELEAMIQAHIQRPLSPPVTPRLPPPEMLINALEIPLLEKLRTSVQPLLEDFRAEIENTLQTRNSEVAEQIWSRLSLTKQVITALSSVIRVPNQGVPSVASS